MSLLSIGYIPLAVISGAAFALLALSYRIAQPRGVSAIHIIAIVCLVGAAFFAVLCARNPAPPPPAWVLLLACSMALSQYGILLLVPRALALGPVSALGCVLSMAFLPVIVYAHFAFGDRVTTMQWSAFPLALGCIAAASFTSGGLRGPMERMSLAALRPGVSVLYPLILLVVFLGNSAPFVAFKELGAHPSALGGSVMDRFGETYFLTFYSALGCATALHVLLRRAWPPSTKAWLGLGLLGAVGSVVGIACLKLAVAGPTASIFMLNNVTTVVVTAVAAAIFFGEGRSLAWFLTVGCGLAAVVLAKLDEVLR